MFVCVTWVSKSNLPFHSITSDNGGEFAKHANISAKFNLQWYFCHPFCSGERGLNENTNGLIRDFFPKRTDFRLLSDDDIKRVQNILNNRPRERIGFVRPAHAMVNHLMAAWYDLASLFMSKKIMLVISTKIDQQSCCMGNC